MAATDTKDNENNPNDNNDQKESNIVDKDKRLSLKAQNSTFKSYVQH